MNLGCEIVKKALLEPLRQNNNKLWSRCRKDN